MTLIPVRCLHCETDQVVKRGTTRNGKQRYRCQNEECVHGSFLLEYSDRGGLPQVKQLDMSLLGLCKSAISKSTFSFRGIFFLTQQQSDHFGGGVLHRPGHFPDHHPGKTGGIQAFGRAGVCREIPILPRSNPFVT